MSESKFLFCSKNSSSNLKNKSRKLKVPDARKGGAGNSVSQRHEVDFGDQRRQC